MTDATADDGSDPVGDMLDVLDLAASDARTTEDIFVGASQDMPHGRVYGGQVLAQAILAASRTLPDERAPHSMHGYFLRPGDSAQSITFAVDRIHDGRSFSTRRTQAFQQGVPIFSMIASFQDAGPGLDHRLPMPDGIPEPEDLPDGEAVAADSLTGFSRPLEQSPIDVRHVTSSIYLEVDHEEPRQAVWLRTRRSIGDDPALHRAVLAYVSDRTIQESPMRAHGIAWSTPGLRVASLDHAMWWHRPARVDEWMLYVQEAPSSRGGRGLATGRIYSRGGDLLASVAQEIMMRVPEER